MKCLVRRSREAAGLLGVGAGLVLSLRPALTSCGGGGLQPATRPNILFLFADDQRSDTVAASGNSYIDTPYIDRLTALGFSFRSNYCMGGNTDAVCVSSRAMLQTGLAYLRVPGDLAGFQTLPEILKEQGYTTFVTGKWHNGRESLVRSFSQGAKVFLGGMAEHTRVLIQDLSSEGELYNTRTGESFSSKLFANAAIDFLEGYRGQNPFYAYVSFTAPHDPRQPPPVYRERYYERQLPLPDNFLPQHPFDNGFLATRDENLAAWPRTEEVVRDQLAEYYGMVSHLDGQVGRILQALDRSGHRENTYIIYAADHGLAMGSHGLLGKQNLYEHSMQAPLIVAGPGVPKGQSSQSLTYLLDLFPTVLGLAGLDAPSPLDGKDLAPIWRNEVESVRQSLFLGFADTMRAVRDERWKLILYPKINHRQLFDLAEDPGEISNLAENPGQGSRVAEMTILLRWWQQQLGDQQALSSKNPPARQVDLSGRAREPDQWQPQWIVEKYFDQETK